MELKKRHIIVGNFLGGLAWGVGSVLGATIVIAILVSVLRTINFVPIIGGLSNQIVDEVQHKTVDKNGD